MVDLHEALRPTDPTPPLPMAEIASRARRRGRQRRVRVAGLTAALSLGGLFAVRLITPAAVQTVTADAADAADTADGAPTLADGSDLVVGSVADGPATDGAPSSLPGPDGRPDGPAEPAADRVEGASSTRPDVAPPGDQMASTPSTTQPEATDPTATGAESTVPTGERPSSDTVVSTPDGLRAEVIITSAWEDGHCIQVHLHNGSVSPVTWRVALALSGTMASLWSATLEPVDPAPGGALWFSGEPGYNTTVEPGSSTSFGLCLDT